ncbi:MAG: 3'(2'),5'-bisphosphate nucleotidase CysQ [Desulfobacterales bacterium]|jgi:3'(2'), 5'-bisphosphate nucleotidase|nr:3'(2'),5'-bisphosphate nucleotidase CysQ [Desulfobacterales bacterium]
MDRDALLLTAIRASIRAGRATLDVYQSDHAVDYKEDRSPLTAADTRSHEIIVGHLTATGIPILSEEGKRIPYSERRSWQRLWVVDPLDGTKEFVKRLGEFTVNIALVENQRPTLGVVYVPVKRVLYYGRIEDGAFRLVETGALAELAAGPSPGDPAGEIHRLNSRSTSLPDDCSTHAPFVIVGSRSHATEELHAFVEQKRRELGAVSFVSAGSSIKYCLVAEGRADIYPRLGPTMEWDTAAGQVIVEAAGATMVRHDTGAPLIYNKEELLNPWHVVTRRKAGAG